MTEPVATSALTPDDTTTPPTETPIPTADPSIPGGGLLLVYQLDGTNPGKATKETVFTLNVGSGERQPMGSLVVDADSCCPTFVQWTADRTKAFLFSQQARGIVDIASATIEPSPISVPKFGAVPSPDGQRFAWVDAVTGAAETIVVADSAGRELSRLALPDGSWATRDLVWSPNGQTILATTFIPLQGSSAQPAAYFCCSIDHGPSASHLLAVPIDGSQLRDLFDDAAEVELDLTAPPPPPAALGLKGGQIERQVSGGRWSPDGGSVSVVQTTCWTDKSGGLPRSWKRGCTVRLIAEDVLTGNRRVLLDTTGGVIDAAWSPDGSRLLIATTPRDSAPGIDLIDLATGTRKHLADTGVRDLDRVLGWSPDGAWIEFDRLSSRLVGDRIDVWVMRSNGHDQQLVAKHAVAGW